MRWPFGSRLTGEERSAARALVEHLQRMYAYQQLTMERFNDAAALVSGSGTPTDEGLMRPQLLIADPGGVVDYVLPSLDFKLSVVGRMEAMHEAFPRPSSPTIAKPYDDYTTVLTILRARSELQYDGMLAWSEDPSIDVDALTSSLDSADRAAMIASSTSLNKLVKDAGLAGDPWLDLNCRVFNEVRAEAEMPPLAKEDFRLRLAAGMAGRPARFFRD